MKIAYLIISLFACGSSIHAQDPYVRIRHMVEEEHYDPEVEERAQAIFDAYLRAVVYAHNRAIEEFVHHLREITNRVPELLEAVIDDYDYNIH